MSVALREVKRRINSTRHIRKVTSALQQVSSAKLSRDRRNVASSSRYTEEIVAMLQGIAAAGTDLEHPLFRPATDDPVCVLVIGSDRGLCGGYNSAVMDGLVSLAESMGKERLSLIVVGEIPRKRAAAMGFRIEASYGLPPLEERKELLDGIVEQMARGFERGHYGRGMVIYTHFISPINKRAVLHHILPMSAISLIRETDAAERIGPHFFDTAIYDPSANGLIDALVPEVLRQAVDYCYLHSVCSEDAYRQEAMMRASENAGDMLRDLKLSYSRLRQESITTEMLEIASSGGMASLQS